MIPKLPGWSWELRHDGVVTAPPEGKALGFVRYTERNRPILRVRELVKRLELDRRFRITAVGKPERLVTDEGEYAALVTVDGLLLEAPVQHTVAFVFLEDFYSMIDGVALRPEERGRFAHQIRHLALHDAHMQGELRRRRFYYEGPPSWTGIASFLHTYWFPVDYPRNPSSLTVVPAIPVPRGSKDFMESIALQQATQGPGFAIDTIGQATPLVTKHKLNGNAWEVFGRLEGQMGFRDIHVLEDGRFAYTVLLESPRDRHDENLVLMRALVDTIEAIPHAGEFLSAVSKESMNHWAE